MRHLILTAALLAGLFNGPAATHAQTSENKHAISARLNFFDYGWFYDQKLRASQGFELGYLRNVSPFFNVGGSFKVGNAQLPEKTNKTVMLGLEAIGQLQQMKESTKVSPFVFAGLGFGTERFEKTNIYIPAGAGANFRLSKWAFLSPQIEFRKGLSANRDNVNIGLGFVYLMHPSPIDTSILFAATAPSGPKDSDGDGVLDFTDACPDVKGLRETFGCPDSDGDGVSDNEDRCPAEKGPAITLGCPDADGDGTSDKLDECPGVSGKVNGCPDSDNDGFADKNDECPTEAGRWNGCPDTDFDGVADKNDKCPNDPGPITTDGCPKSMVQKDSDLDGFADERDECPTAAGKLRGCPDRDDDGFADKDDACPDQKGSMKGCPDSDGDLFSDNVDKCPTQNGPLNGCPDTDGDGWADGEDKCPSQKGTFEGCPSAPIKDTDNDGFPDDKDKCPTQNGAFDGCPTAPIKDTDGDGVADSQDNCPNIAGVASNAGCPEVKKEVRERLAFATKAVQFESGKAVLKVQSYQILDEVASILQQNPEYKLRISGHTDDQGNDAVNMNLSAERAKVCFDYLNFKGLNTARMRSAGFGETRPIASNFNEEGRLLNRRVEFEIAFE